MKYKINKETFEDKFDRKWAIYYQRAGVSNYWKTRNRRLFRKKLKREIESEVK